MNSPEPKVTTIKTIKMKSKGIKSIQIADPWYLEPDCKRTDLTFKSTIADGGDNEIRITEEKLEYPDGITCNSTRVHAFFNVPFFDEAKGEVAKKNNDVLKRAEEIWLSDGSYFQNFKSKIVDLGCDTAQFMLKAKTGNKTREITVNTGADGYYGCAIKYKKITTGAMVGFILEVDAEMCDAENMKEILEYVLNAEVIEEA